MLKYFRKKPNTTLFKEVDPKIWLCLFRFRSITLKQLNGLTSIDTFNCLAGLDVIHQTVLREVRGSSKDFYVQ